MKRTKQKKSARFRFSRPSRRQAFRFWPALVLGLGLLVLTGILYQQMAAARFNDALLRKLPADSYAAGVADLNTLDAEAVKQLSAGTGAGQPQTTAILDFLTRTSATRDKLVLATERQFAFASTSHGSLAVLNIRNVGQLAELAKSLDAAVVEKQQTSENGIVFYAGKLPETGATVAAATNGRELYLASNTDLIKQSLRETTGFTGVPKFAELADSLPGGRQGYLFFQPTAARGKVPADLPLTGLAFNVRPDKIDLIMATSATPADQRLPRADGRLLPAFSQMSAAVEGKDIDRFIHLLEAQRQESDVPKVLGLQNGLVSLNRTLGVNLEDDYLRSVDRFVYGRFLADTGVEWAGLLEFDSAQEANAKTQSLSDLVRQKVTVPVRKEVVTILPDGSQSREVVSEGREPIQFVPIDVAGRQGSAFRIPGSLGTLHYLVEGRYLVLSSTPDGLNRMLTIISNPTPSDERGELVVRVNLRDLRKATGEPDSFSDWAFAGRPASGHFTLDRASGELNGSLNFDR